MFQQTHRIVLLSIGMAALSFANSTAAQGFDRQIPTIQTLEYQLRKGDDAAQQRAARALIKRGDEGVAIVVKYLINGESNCEIADILKSSRLSLLSFLVPAFKDKNDVIRRRAVEVVQFLDDRDFIPALIAIRHDESAEVRSAVVVTFSNMKDRRTVIALLDLYHTNPETGAHSLSTLNNFGRLAAEGLAEIEVIANRNGPEDEPSDPIHDELELASKCLASIGEPAVPAIRKMIRGENLSDEIRIRGMRCVSQMIRSGEHHQYSDYPAIAAQLVPDLIDILKGSNTTLHPWAITELMTLAERAKAAVPQLERMMPKAMPPDRLSIACALFAIDPKNAKGIEEITEALTLDSYGILNRLQPYGPKCKPFLKKAIELLDNEDKLMRYYSINLIERLGAEAKPALPRLKVLAEKDPSPMVRDNAKRAIKSIETSEKK